MINNFINYLLTSNATEFKALFYKDAFLYDLSKSLPFEGVDAIYGELIRTFRFLNDSGMQYHTQEYQEGQDTHIAKVIFKDKHRIGRVVMSFRISVVDQLIDHVFWKKN